MPGAHLRALFRLGRELTLPELIVARLDSWNRTLSNREVWWLCLLAVGLHLLPLILADYAYIDDVWRAQLAGVIQDANDSWTGQGRLLIDWFHAAIGFADAAPNVFPLPLLIAAVLSAWALASLVLHYFETPRATSLLVVLPLWYNPFFLQNLSYQYDAPLMALALAACVAAICVGSGRWSQFATSSALVAVAVGFYQVSINVFAGLCCIEIIRLILAQQALPEVLRHASLRLGQLFVGCAVYYFTAYQLITVPRTALLPIDDQWPGEILRRLGIVAEHVGLLMTPGTTWFFVGLCGLALLKLLATYAQLLGSQRPAWERVALGVLLASAVAAGLLLTAGMTLLFKNYNAGARLLMGMGPALVMLALLAQHTLVGWHQRLAWLLAIPLMFMLSFSFAYGRVLVAQQELQRLVTFSLAQEIASRPQLYEAKRFYVHGIGSSGRWLPAASGSYEVMPALRYVLNIDFLLLVEMMPRVGMVNFGARPPLDRPTVLARSPTPVVDAKFFSIHRVEDNGYVLMKTPWEAEGFFK
ncbi:hypothetical protein D3C76_400420 [compost metagenome]